MQDPSRPSPAEVDPQALSPVPQAPLVLTSSRIACFNECRARHYARYIACRATEPGGATALELGRQAHRAWAGAWGGEAPAFDLVSAMPPGIPTTLANQAKQVGYWMARWWQEGRAQAPFSRVLGVERGVRVRLGIIEGRDVFIQTKFDTIVEGAGPYAGALWNLELKTRSCGSVENAIEDHRSWLWGHSRTMQAQLYPWALSESLDALGMSGLPVGGTLVISVDKVSEKFKNGTPRTLADAVRIEPIFSRPEMVRLAMLDAWHAALAIHADEQYAGPRHTIPVPQTGRGHSCHTVFGDCQYGPVCDLLEHLDMDYMRIDPFAYYEEDAHYPVVEVFHPTVNIFTLDKLGPSI